MQRESFLLEYPMPDCQTDAGYTDGTHFLRLNVAGNAYLSGEENPCVVFGNEFVNGRALGGDFGRTAGDFVEYQVECPEGAHMKLHLRASGAGTFLMEGCASGEIELATEELSFYVIPIGAAGGTLSLSLTCTMPSDTGAVIDLLCAADTPIRILAPNL